MKSILKWKVCFSFWKKATNGSSFSRLEKQLEMKNLEMDGWKLLLMKFSKQHCGFVVGTFKTHWTGVGVLFLCCKIRQ